MNKQISNVITQLRVISTIVIVVYHAACPYGGWEAFTATISNNISFYEHNKLNISEITL